MLGCLGAHAVLNALVFVSTSAVELSAEDDSPQPVTPLTKKTPSNADC